jgi:hypothetical protein
VRSTDVFEIFPDNYTWNLAVNIALNTGAHITEVAEACAPVLEASGKGDDSGTEQFFRSWTALADRIVGLAEEAEAAGHPLTAGALFSRASVYYLTAERLQSRHYAPRRDAYRKMLHSFDKGIVLGRRNCTKVEIPYEGTCLPGLFVAAEGVTGPAPCMVHYNGLDSTKEMVHGSGIADELARRGISTLIVDHPGTGEALRSAGSDRATRQRTLVGRLRRLAGEPRRHRHGTYRCHGLVAGRLLRAPRRRLRKALQPLCRLGRQLQLGRAPKAPAGP